MKKIAVILSGCGFRDGSEITESVSVLISLSKFRASYKIFAPEISFKSIDHISGKEKEERDILTESARIARGDIQSLDKLRANDFDALVFPGGFGVASKLCNWAEKGSQCDTNSLIEGIIKGFHRDQKPICAICIAPTLISKILGSYEISVTIGKDKATAIEIEKTGASHVNCTVDDYVSDRENKIISTPAYMFSEASPHEVFSGIQKAIKELVEMA